MSKIIIEGVIGEVYDWLQDEIKATSYKGMEAKLKDVSDDIELHINSKGGDAFEGMAIMNQLKQYDKGTKTAIVDGFCASAATLPLFAMDHVKAHQTSVFVFHKAATMAFGHANDIRKTADELDTIDGMVTDLYMTKFTGSRAELDTLLDEDKIITAQQALEYGFIDEIVADDKQTGASMDATELDVNLDAKPSLDEVLEERNLDLAGSFLKALSQVNMSK